MDDEPGTIARPRELLIVSVMAVALAVLMTWPLAAGLGSLGRTQSDDSDGQWSIWNVAWVARTIVADPLDLYDANIFHPHRTTLAYSEANIVEGLIGAPAYWLSGGNPWLTLNIVMLAAFASGYTGAYLLLRHLSGDRRAAAAGAVLYAFCPYVMSHLPHIQLLFTGGIPLSMLLAHRVADAPSLRRGTALGVALAAQALSCAYYGIFAGLMAGYATLVFASTRRLWRSLRYWRAIAAGAIASIAIVVPFFLPYLRVQEESGFRRTMEEATRYSADAHFYLASAARAHAWLLEIARGVGPVHEVMFPGVLAVALAAAGVAVASRGHGASARGRETLLLYGTLAALAAWASFGPDAGLYRVLSYLPAFSFLRAPARFGLVVVLGLVAIASLALARLFSALPPDRRPMAGGVALALAVADITVIPIGWARAPDVPSPYTRLADGPRGALAEFPFYGERVAFPLHTQYMLFSTFHWMPMVNGYSDVIPPDFREAAVVLGSFPSSDAFAALARRRVRYIGVHWDMYGPRAEEIRSRLEPFAGKLKALAADGRMTLYEVVAY
jgi:hypothetical protein